MVKAILVVIMMVFLIACGNATVPPPDTAVVTQAITLHLGQIQQELLHQLRIDSPEPPQFEVKHVAIADKQRLTIESLPGFRLQGSYDLTLNLPKRKIVQKHNPFELYLQQQPDGQTWYWARQIGAPKTEEIWVTQPVPPPPQG